MVGSARGDKGIRVPPAPWKGETPSRVLPLAQSGQWQPAARLVRLTVPMTSRRDEVVKLNKAGLSYAEIGRRLNISRERARQIATDKPTPQKPRNLMLTTGDVAQLLGVHPNTVRHWSQNGILKAYRLGPRGDRRFRRADVEGLLKEQ